MLLSGRGLTGSKSRGTKKIMGTSSQNSFNQQQPLLTPGRVINKVKRYVSPFGQVVEIRRATITVQDDQGIFRTEKLVEVVPPLADGTMPEDPGLIRCCFRCFSLIHVENSYTCPSCGLVFCLPDTAVVDIEGQKVRVCAECAKSIRSPWLQLAKKFLWG